LAPATDSQGAGDPERLSLTGQALPIAALATRYGIDVTS